MSGIAEILYKCVRCGKTATKEEWQRGEPKLDEWEIKEMEKRMVGPTGGIFKCPYCSYHVAKKMRAPVVKRVKCV